MLDRAEYGILILVFEAKYKKANEPLDEVKMVWVETLKELLRRKDLIELYGNKTVQRARDFDMEKIAKEWKKVLKEVL